MHYNYSYDYDTRSSDIPLQSTADANADGFIDASYVILIRKYIVGYDYTSGTFSEKLGPKVFATE
jgi:hypothetical protein